MAAVGGTLRTVIVKVFVSLSGGEPLSVTRTATWADAALPWFQAHSLNTLKSAEPVAVITPFPCGAAFLRSKLIEHGIALLGVKFLTPPLLRELLLGHETAIPLREHLRLLLAAAAERIAEKNADDVDLCAIAKSIARAPDNLLRVFDQVSAAGWSWEQFASPAILGIPPLYLRSPRP